MNLFEIASEYKELLENGFDPETGEVCDQTINQLQVLSTNIKEKGINIASYIKNLEAEEMAVDAACAQMELRRKVITRKIESLYKYLESNMEKCGIYEISCAYFVAKLKKCPPSVNVSDENMIPDEYKKVKETISLDKEKIKKEILSGIDVPGASLKQNMRLEIK